MNVEILANLANKAQTVSLREIDTNKANYCIVPTMWAPIYIGWVDC